jgi:hypothetical protein
MKLLLILISFNCFALSNDEARDLFKNHLESIVKNDESDFKKTTSDSYYKSLKEKSQIKEMFKMNKGNKVESDFDVKINKAANEKNVYFVNIKDKKAKSYDHNWYRVIKKDKLLIDGTRFFD